MYWEYFGCTEPPFALTPNPAFLFLSSCHQEAFAHLLYGIDHRVGFIELSGEVGSGKTTVIRTLLSQLDPAIHRSALIFNPTISPLALLQEVNREFGLPCASTDSRELLHVLNDFLLEENRAGHTVVLVIDEAQNLSPEVLEQVRLISNLETERAKLIQIVLVGQPELRPLLARPELRQLQQRITVRYHLAPLHGDETRDYIRHRLRVAAGGREPVSFSLRAVQRIHRFSQGLPRLINAVCDRALLLAYTRETTEITPAMAKQAIADLRSEERRPVVRWRVVAVGLLLVALATAAALVAVPHQEPTPAAQPAAPRELPFSRETALTALAAEAPGGNQLTAVNAILEVWQAPPAAAAPGRVQDLRAIARQRGLSATPLTTDLAALARLDAPALLQVSLPGGGSRLLALTALGRERARVVPKLGGRSSLTRDELAGLWGGQATILWKNFYAIPPRLRPGSTDPRVKQLQELLKGAGHLSGSVSGVFDRPTEEGLRAFQRAEGLAPDGKAGERTLLHLYRRAGGFFPPGITRDAGPGEGPQPMTSKERKG